MTTTPKTTTMTMPKCKEAVTWMGGKEELTLCRYFFHCAALFLALFPPHYPRLYFFVVTFVFFYFGAKFSPPHTTHRPLHDFSFLLPKSCFIPTDPFVFVVAVSFASSWMRLYLDWTFHCEDKLHTERTILLVAPSPFIFRRKRSLNLQ